MWSLGISRILVVDPKRITKSASLTWALCVLLIGLLLVGVSILLDIPLQDSKIHLKISIYVATLYSLSTGIVAYIFMKRIVNQLGLENMTQSTSVRVGIAAMLGFVMFYVLLHLLGWRIGDPNSIKLWKMTTIVMVSNLGAALAAGAAMGWILVQDKIASNLT